MTHLLRAGGVFDRHPFVLIDVGCAGGIDDAWRAFGPSLVAHAYDPDVAACEDAQARESFDSVQYHACRVGLPETHPFAQQRREDAARWPNTNIWGRITAGYLAERAQKSSPPPQPPMADQNSGPPLSTGWPTRALLSGWTISSGPRDLATVDFLKIDVDGPDLEVLESARDILTTSRVLGVGMEVNWFGSANPTEHTFHNTDRLPAGARVHTLRADRSQVLAYRPAGALRKGGLRLYAFRAALPGGCHLRARPGRRSSRRNRGRATRRRN